MGFRLSISAIEFVSSIIHLIFTVAPGKTNTISLARTTTTRKSQPSIDLRQPSEVFSRSKNTLSYFHLFITIYSIYNRISDCATILKGHSFISYFTASIGQPTRSSPTVTTTSTKIGESTIPSARETFSRSTRNEYLFPHENYESIYSCSIDQLPLLIIQIYAD